MTGRTPIIVAIVAGLAGLGVSCAANPDRETITVGPSPTATLATPPTTTTTTTTTTTAPERRLRVGLIGDSFAVTLAREDAGVHWVAHARSACPLFRAPTDPACEQHHDQTAGFVDATRYDVAVLVFGGGADRADACTDVTSAADMAALDGLGTIASRNRALPLAVATIPVWPGGNPTNVECTNVTIRQWAADNGARLIDLATYAAQSSAPVRADGIHWFGDAAETVGRWIVEQLRRP